MEGSTGDTALVPAGDLDTVLLVLLVELFDDGATLATWLGGLDIPYTGDAGGALISFAFDDTGMVATDASGRRVVALVELEALVPHLVGAFVAARGLVLEALVEWLGDRGVLVAHLD